MTNAEKKRRFLFDTERARQLLDALQSLAKIAVLAGVLGYIHYIGLVAGNISVSRKETLWWAAFCATPVVFLDIILLLNIGKKIQSRLNR